MTRVLLIALGLVAVGAGIVAIFVPMVPTTPFLLVASWAFARSSPRLQRWLREHPRLGPLVDDWEDAGVIPVRAKVLAISMMGASLAWVGLTTTAPAIAVVAMGVTLAGVAGWMVRQPSRRPPT